MARTLQEINETLLKNDEEIIENQELSNQYLKSIDSGLKKFLQNLENRRLDDLEDKREMKRLLALMAPKKGFGEKLKDSLPDLSKSFSPFLNALKTAAKVLGGLAAAFGAVKLGKGIRNMIDRSFNTKAGQDLDRLRQQEADARKAAQEADQRAKKLRGDLSDQKKIRSEAKRDLRNAVTEADQKAAKARMDEADTKIKTIKESIAAEKEKAKMLREARTQAGNAIRDIKKRGITSSYSSFSSDKMIEERSRVVQTLIDRDGATTVAEAIKDTTPPDKPAVKPTLTETENDPRGRDQRGPWGPVEPDKPAVKPTLTETENDPRGRDQRGPTKAIKPSFEEEMGTREAANSPEPPKAKGPEVMTEVSTLKTPDAGPVDSGYKVQSGDSLSKIARQNNTTLKAILDANPDILDPDKIRVGQDIRIPGNSVTPEVANTNSAPKVANTNSAPKVGGDGPSMSPPAVPDGDVGVRPTKTSPAARLDDVGGRALGALLDPIEEGIALASEAATASRYAALRSIGSTVLKGLGILGSLPVQTVMLAMTPGQAADGTLTGFLLEAYNELYDALEKGDLSRAKAAQQLLGERVNEVGIGPIEQYPGFGNLIGNLLQYGDEELRQLSESLVNKNVTNLEDYRIVGRTGQTSPVGRVSAARAPGQMGSIRAGDELSGSDIASAEFQPGYKSGAETTHMRMKQRREEEAAAREKLLQQQGIGLGSLAADNSISDNSTNVNNVTMNSGDAIIPHDNTGGIRGFGD